MRSIILTLIISFLYISSYGQICVGTPGQVQWECWRGLYAGEFSELSALEFYPTKPEISQTIYSLNAPPNYADYMGCRMSGFIHVPVTDSVTFNITGNKRARFFLSSDSNPNNVVQRAFVPNETSELEHTKFPEQTSTKILLQANQYYYFVIEYIDDWSSDHCRLFWKNSFISNTTWNVVSGSYLHSVGCLPASCPDRGTPCDDNNPQTTDDKQDGHCHCVGKPTTTNICVGERNTIQNYRYNNIAGSSLNDLYNAPDFPAIPATSTKLPRLGTGYESLVNNIGNMVQGYLTVPITGNYKFNITGDDMTILFISSDYTPENRQAHQVLVSGWTGTTEHTKYIYQSTSNILMEAGKYYYFEINHKDGSGGEHYNAYWQTPFTQSNTWKRIPEFYIYDYNCDIACVPQGTPCNDGNVFTNNDMYDNNCQCIGTPCTGPDCNSPIANYTPYEKCGVTDQLDNTPANNWLSCQVSSNPNPVRNRGHWISYDLGERHQLISSHIWNYNVQNEANKGFQAVVVDYSENGTTWNTLGQYNWPLATGESGYGGFIGPDLTNVYAKYLLITSLDDTMTCRGLGKVAFKAVLCPPDGTTCDDLNPQTVNDVYTSCQCTGQNLLVNACEDINLNLGNVMLQTDVYSASQYLSATSTISQQNTVGFVGGKSVILEPGFETQPDAVFIASIDTCATNVSGAKNSTPEVAALKIQNNLVEELMIVPVPNTDMVDIHFYIPSPGRVLLKIKDGISNYTLIDHEYTNKGHFRKRIRTKKLHNALPLVVLTTAKNTYTKKLVEEKF